MNIFRWAFIGCFACIASFLLYIILQERRERTLLQESIEQLQERFAFPLPHEKPAVEIISNEPSQKELTADNWRSIQGKTRDTVVQIFAQSAELDLRQPYKTPMQYSSLGSGFFINDEGEIITNAHVVGNAVAIWIQIPSLGKRIFDVNVLGIAPERDLALLRISDDGRDAIREELGSIPYLTLGNSDLVRRADEVMALGYPLGQHSLKSTTGVISGYESSMIQMSAPINPGSSGGPLLNLAGEVVGVNSSGFVEAQNVGYIIPINELNIILPDLERERVLHKPFLGILYSNGTDALAEYLGNPAPAGSYVVEVVDSSILSKAGMQIGDMIYELNGHRVDAFGEMQVPWRDDKIAVTDYISRLAVGSNVHIVAYRKGDRKEFDVTLRQVEQPAIRKIYPAFEDIDYETIAGMDIMQLSVNHIAKFANKAPGLARYAELKNQSESVLVITNIVPTSRLARDRAIGEFATIKEVNGYKVTSLNELRSALKDSLKTGFLTMRVEDNLARLSDNIFVALPFDRIAKEEPQLAADCRRHITASSQELLYAWYEKSENQLSFDLGKSITV